MSKASKRKQQTRPRQMSRWLIVSGVIVLGLALGGGWLYARNPAQSGNAQPLSRLSTRDFHSLAFSPTEPDTVFFGHHDGLLVSRDGGRTWRSTALQNADAMALAAPAANPQVMYAAGHDVFLKSTDAGQTWQPVSTNLPGTDMHGFAVDPQDASHVYTHVVGSGIFSSQDGGTTWTLLSSTVPDTTFNLAVGETAQTLYAAAGQAGSLHSSDGGQNWSTLSSVPGGGAVALAYSPANKRLYVTTLGNAAGVYASDDGGTHWIPLGLKGTLLAIAISPLDPNRLIAVSDRGDIYASRDGGLTWPNK